MRARQWRLARVCAYAAVEWGFSIKREEKEHLKSVKGFSPSSECPKYRLLHFFQPIVQLARLCCVSGNISRDYVHNKEVLL